MQTEKERAEGVPALPVARSTLSSPERSEGEELLHVGPGLDFDQGVKGEAGDGDGCARRAVVAEELRVGLVHTRSSSRHS